MGLRLTLDLETVSTCPGPYMTGCRSGYSGLYDRIEAGYTLVHVRLSPLGIS